MADQDRELNEVQEATSTAELEKEPLFEEKDGEETEGKESFQEKTFPEEERSDDLEEEEEVEGEDEFEDIEELSLGGKGRKLKWVLIGFCSFLLVLLLSFFFASLYVKRKQAALGKKRTKITALKTLKKKKKIERKVVITQYDLSPFLLRIRDHESGEDRFLSIRLYIEFIGKKVPPDVVEKKDTLRTLVYNELKKHFSKAKDSVTIERAFKKELVPALNTFLKGGGVYDVGFKEFVIR